MQVFVKTLKGLEEVLAQEIRDLGGEDIKVSNRGVSCYGDLEFVYKCNLMCRTALRVLVPIGEYIVHTERDFYRKMKKVDWSEYMTIDQTFAIDAVSHSKIFRHSKFMALRVKDAIVDQFKERVGERPNVETQNPDIRFNVHIADKKVVLSLDSSGYSLHRRGYRVEGHESPINEVLAAGILKLTNWSGDQPLIDPMCGTGTIVIEAALMAQNKCPHVKRKGFSFTNWKSFDKKAYADLLNDIDSNVKEGDLQIIGQDINTEVVDIARRTIQIAGLSKVIQLKQQSFFDGKNQLENGILISNPPYGERLDLDNSVAFYKSIGDQLKSNYQGFEAWLISSNFPALKMLGLRPSKKIPMVNGALECKLQKYELYAGSKKRV